MNTERLAAKEQATRIVRKRGNTWKDKLARPADSYGLVLGLVVLAYIMISLESASAWLGVCVVALQGLVLYFALRTSRARRVWVLLAGFFLVFGTAISIVDAVFPAATYHSDVLQALGGALLLVTPVAILRRIITHTVVTAQTILGAISVYVLIGFSFASLYGAFALLSHTPFFVGVPYATRNDYLFFSYTTLTTVGYGNLVPAGTTGQAFAMLEALLGQIYLVIVVARLVSLWGSQRPTAPDPPPEGD